MTLNFEQLLAGIARKLPCHLRVIYYWFLQRILFCWDRHPRVLTGRPLRKLRGDIVRATMDRELCGTTNCGLIKYRDGYLGIYKEGTFNSCWELGIKVPVTSATGIRQKLWLATFNDRLKLEARRLISVRLEGLDAPLYDTCILEDARIVHYNDTIVVVVNSVPFPNGPSSFPDQKNAWPLIGVLDLAASSIDFKRLSLEYSAPPQKNWIPFSYGGNLYLQYSINPHRVLETDVSTGLCSDICQTSVALADHKDLVDLKGGAPLIDIGESLLGGCHSWELGENGARDYKTYFFLADKGVPFQITRISPPVKLLVPERIQYLTAILLINNGKDLLLSFGVNDCDNYFIAISVKKVLNLMS